MAGKPGGRRKYPDIPEKLRAAASEYVRLLRAGLPIPEDVREKRREYRRLIRRGGSSSLPVAGVRGIVCWLANIPYLVY